jgi:hypothetical protein
MRFWVCLDEKYVVVSDVYIEKSTVKTPSALTVLRILELINMGEARHTDCYGRSLPTDSSR